MPGLFFIADLSVMGRKKNFNNFFFNFMVFKPSKCKDKSTLKKKTLKLIKNRKAKKK